MAAQLPNLPLSELADFCRRWKISRLELFGSALREDFGPESDIDLLYTFEPGARISLFDLDDIEAEFESLLGRQVDLVSRSAIERSGNWYRRRHIFDTAQLLYAA